MATSSHMLLEGQSLYLKNNPQKQGKDKWNTKECISG
jgi:hypothetical protein